MSVKPSARSNLNFVPGLGDVTLTGTQTLTNKTLTSPNINYPNIIGGFLSHALLFPCFEQWSIQGGVAPSGTVIVDFASASSVYYTANTSTNWTINFRWNSTTALNMSMNESSSITAVFLATNGATAYRPTTIQVDGSTSGVTVEWQGGTAPSAGNANSIDAYVFSIIKTGFAQFLILASQTKFA